MDKQGTGWWSKWTWYIYKVSKNKGEEVLVKHLVALSKLLSLSGEFIFDSVGNKVMKVFGFRHRLPDGASFLKLHELVLKISTAEQ